MNASNLNSVDNQPVRSYTTEMKIGRNTYTITTHYKENGRETAEQKLLRFVSNRISDTLKQPVNA